MNYLAGLLAPFVMFGAYIGSVIAPEPELGASEAIPTTIAFFETTLAGAITDSATSFTLTSATDKDGTALASSTYAFVIDEGSSNEEIVIADCTGTACTNVMRGVSVLTGNTSVAALKKAHRRGASVKITDAPILMLVARALRGESVTDFTPASNGSLVDKEYVDNLALGSTTVPATLVDDGIGELATGLEAASSTAVGGSGSPLFLHTGISTSTAPTSGSVVPVTGSNGKLANGFIDSSYFLTVASSSAVYEYSTTSTWTKPAWGTFALIELWGGGGSGGVQKESYGAKDGAATGGGGGEFVSFFVPLFLLGSTETVTVGAGGVAKTQSSTGATSGAAGGDTTFGAHATAKGGSGGNAHYNLSTVLAGGAGGTGSSSIELQIKIDEGVAGGTAQGANNPVSANAGASNDYGGAGGGSSAHGDGYAGSPATSAGGTSTYGGNGGAGAFNGNGVDGSTKGGGGGGSTSNNTDVVNTYSSGKGGDGYVRITVF